MHAAMPILLVFAIVAFALTLLAFRWPTLTPAVLLLCIIEIIEKYPGGLK